MKHTLYIIAFFLMLLTACSSKDEKKSYDKMGSNGMTEHTENLADNLKTVSETGCLVGQQYATLRGIGWEGDSARSDIKNICNDFPACNGYDFTGVESGQHANNDGISFDAMRKDILAMARRGGLIIATWYVPQCNNDEKLEAMTQSMAKYFDSLQDDYGIKAPVLLMLMPLDKENMWYNKLSPEEYINNYRKVAKLLKEENETTNVIFGFSSRIMPDAETLISYLPDYNIAAANITYYATDGAAALGYKDKMQKAMEQLSELSHLRSIPVGITTGNVLQDQNAYWSQTIVPLVDNNALSFILFGQNSGEPGTGKNYTPYPGDTGVDDFVKFYNDKKTLFAHDINGLYLKKG